MLTLAERRAIKITELNEELEEAKKIISSLIWPSDMKESERRRYEAKCARFAGCTVPVYNDNAGPESSHPPTEKATNNDGAKDGCMVQFRGVSFRNAM